MSEAIDAEALIQPVPGPNPAGSYLYSDPFYRQIDQARSRNPDADWRFVLRAGLDLLTNRSKDLQIAVHVTEALGRLHGLDGLRQGFDLLTALQNTFWPILYPLPDGTDLEPRLTPYEFLDVVIPPILDVSIALTAAPSVENYNHQRFNHRALSESDKEVRNDAIRRTNIAYHRKIAHEFDACRLAYDSCMKSLQEHAGEKTPVFERLPVLLNGLADCLAIIEKVRPFRTAVPVPSSPTASGDLAPTTVEPIKIEGRADTSTLEDRPQAGSDSSIPSPWRGRSRRGVESRSRFRPRNWRTPAGSTSRSICSTGPANRRGAVASGSFISSKWSRSAFITARPGSAARSWTNSSRSLRPGRSRNGKTPPSARECSAPGSSP